MNIDFNTVHSITDAQLDTVVGGMQDNGIGQHTRTGGPGALPITGNAGTGVTSIGQALGGAFGALVGGAVIFGVAASALFAGGGGNSYVD